MPVVGDDYTYDIDTYRQVWDDELASLLILGEEGPGAAFHGIDLYTGSTIYSKGFGKASVANDVDFDVDTVTGVRSCTKTMTQALVLKAHDEFGGIIDSAIGNYSVITNNIGRWENRFIPADARAEDAKKPPNGTGFGRTPPVHTTATLRQIAGHTSEIWPAGKYLEQTNGKARPCYNPLVTGGGTGVLSEWTSADNMTALKNLMESIESVDDIVAMAGAVMKGVNNPQSWTPTPHQYQDKAGWLSAAVCEQLFGDSWYNLVQAQFDQMLPAGHSAYPSYDGNALFGQNANQEWTAFFKGHNANPIEIPKLATSYKFGPPTTRSPLGLYLEPEQSTESGYAIGCAAMSVVDLCNWARELVYPSGANPYLSAARIQDLMTVQTPWSNDNPGAAIWPRINWGFGTHLLSTVTSMNGDQLEIWGTQGNGGFGGYGGAVCWVEGNSWGQTHRAVFAGTSNSGIAPTYCYQMAKDYARTFIYAQQP